jgi:hypothetical protein
MIDQRAGSGPHEMGSCRRHIAPADGSFPGAGRKARSLKFLR